MDFDHLSIPVRLSNLLLLLLSLLLLYELARTVHTVFLGELSRVPGPKLAAATRLYELYHINIKNDWYEHIVRLHTLYGPMVRIGPNEVHFNDAHFTNEHHKQAHLRKCSTYYGSLSHIMGGMPDPTSHAQRKSIIQPLFGGQRLADFSSRELNSHIRKLCEHLRAEADSGREVNLTHYLWAFTTDVMFDYVLGQDFKLGDTPDLQSLHDKTRAFSAIDLVTVLRSIKPVAALFAAVPLLRSLSPLGWLDSIVSDQLRPITNGDYEKGNPSRSGVLSDLFGRLQDERLVTHEASQAIFIGNESLLSNTTALLHEMMQQPAYIKKLRSELDQLDIGTYGHEVWRDPKVMHLRYLDAICRESTRLSAPGWHRQPRQTNERVEYNGISLPPMTSLSFTVRLHERSPELWPSPDEFLPDRWLGPDAQTARKQSVTFGTGPRTCLGQHIARHVLRKALACLVYNFDIEPWDAQKDSEENFRYLNTYPKQGTEGYFRVRLLSRFRPVE